jgi:hypothetical protein
MGPVGFRLGSTRDIPRRALKPGPFLSCAASSPIEDAVNDIAVGLPLAFRVQPVPILTPFPILPFRRSVA